MMQTECVPVTGDLNLWDAQLLMMFMRPSRMGFLRLVSQMSCKSHLMDLAFLKKYASMQEEKELDLLIDLGTCGLHVVHSSMKAGAKASEWELQKLLKAMWQFIQIVQIDPLDKNIRKSAAGINIGFAANIKVEESNLNSNDPKVLTFEKEAGNFLAALLSHLLEKLSLK